MLKQLFLVVNSILDIFTLNVKILVVMDFISSLLLANLDFVHRVEKKYNDAMVKKISKKCINVSHRHIVFTISNRLWPYFQKDRNLIDCLF